ncbi:hypothetical protein EYF80_044512 [Liparis tanakae]|uniref:Uncharacterized protein n=1 Tax=Liparis tanakae TaxID=230148 RepID=A0A4Z2FY83_9TELE|nr:hypothetical protein EYF80_044512 [Liparis tanakae]
MWVFSEAFDIDYKLADASHRPADGDQKQFAGPPKHRSPTQCGAPDTNQKRQPTQFSAVENVSSDFKITGIREDNRAAGIRQSVLHFI